MGTQKNRLNETVLLSTQNNQDGSHEHPEHQFEQMNKKIIAILRSKILLNWRYEEFMFNT